MSLITENKDDGKPHNPLVDSMLTDLYQITMAYAYWKGGRADEQSTFDLFFRKHPFHGEFTIFAGLEECIRFVSNFGFSEDDITVLKQSFPQWDDGFWTYLGQLDASALKLYAIPEGSVVFPAIPLIRVEGPLALAQLVETTLLVLVNYASLVCTNAARHRLAAPDKTLLEFGLRRAQGPDGGMSASKYSFIGGFDGTSNVSASTKFDITMKGTHAHSFVVSFVGINDIKDRELADAKSGEKKDFVDVCLRCREEIDGGSLTNEGELAAFISYALAYPSGFLALVDTYDTLTSGCINFLAVAMALHEFGYKAIGIRLDSGDLAYLSKAARALFVKHGADQGDDYNYFGKFIIVASNDLSEAVLWSLKEQGHEIDSFGIGTNLVTCKTQPALGCVYKLVEINGTPRIKLSQDVVKVTIPGKKLAYRLYNSKNEPMLDLLAGVNDKLPVAGQRILARHPYDARKRANVTPSRVEPLHECVWDGKVANGGKPFPSLVEMKARVAKQLSSFREDHLRHLNPTPYKISLTAELFDYMHDLWLKESPIAELE